MKSLILPAGIAGVVLIASLAYAGVHETKAYKLSVTLPASSGIQAQSQIFSPIPDRDVITEATLRNNEPVIIKTAIVK
jgi:hypothetical protein